MLILLKSKRAQDFYNSFIATKSGAKVHSLEEHHIFPINSIAGKKIIKDTNESKFNDIINNIGNIALLTKETNNNKIKSNNPSKYIKEFEDEYKKAGKLKEFYKIMQSQFISKEMIECLKNDDFFKFIFLRTKKLLNHIENLTNI
jgi:hypothetical protein